MLIKFLSGPFEGEVFNTDILNGRHVVFLPDEDGVFSPWAVDDLSWDFTEYPEFLRETD